MSDKFLKHLISIIASLLCIAVYLTGYVSGVNGWWFTGFSVVVFYIIVLNLVDA